MKYYIAIVFILFVRPSFSIDLSNYAWGVNPSQSFIINDASHVLSTTPFYSNGSGSCEHRGGHINFERPAGVADVTYIDVFSPVDGTLNYPPANPSMGVIATPTSSVDCGRILSNGNNLPKVNLSVAFDDAVGDSVNFLLSLETQSVNARCGQIQLLKDPMEPVLAGELLARLPVIGDTHPDDRVPHIHFNLTINGYSGQFCPNIFTRGIANAYLALHDWPTSGHCGSYPAPSNSRDAFCYILSDAADLTGN